MPCRGIRPDGAGLFLGMQRPAPRQQNFFPIASPRLHDQESSGSANAVDTIFNNQHQGAAGAIPTANPLFGSDRQSPVEMACDRDTTEPAALQLKHCKSLRRTIHRLRASPANTIVRANRHPNKITGILVPRS
jgi:hypothetical protein